MLTEIIATLKRGLLYTSHLWFVGKTGDGKGMPNNSLSDESGFVVRQSETIHIRHGLLYDHMALQTPGFLVQVPPVGLPSHGGLT